jgi:hypothetical protein
MQGGVLFGITSFSAACSSPSGCARTRFTTLIDPFRSALRCTLGVVLSIPAVMAEVFWSAELLVALGATFGVISTST